MGKYRNGWTKSSSSSHHNNRHALFRFLWKTSGADWLYDQTLNKGLVLVTDQLCILTTEDCLENS